MPPEDNKEREKRVENLKALRAADELVLSAVEAAAGALNLLAEGKTDANVELDLEKLCAQFVADVHNAMAHIRGRISDLSSDLPFENATLNHLINADLAVQRTAHVHRSLRRTLARLEQADGEAMAGVERPAQVDANITEELLDASGMTPPADLMG